MTLEEWMKSEVKVEVEQQVKERVERVEQQVKEAGEKVYEETSERFLKLTTAMISDGMANEVKRLLDEPVFLEEMLKKYEL